MKTTFDLNQELYSAMTGAELVALLLATGKPSEALQLAAVTADHTAIQHIKRPRTSVRLAAMRAKKLHLKEIDRAAAEALPERIKAAIGRINQLMAELRAA